MGFRCVDCGKCKDSMMTSCLDDVSGRWRCLECNKKHRKEFDKRNPNKFGVRK